MYNDWNKGELLTKRSIEAYKNNRASKLKFDQHFIYDKYIKASFNVGIALGPIIAIFFRDHISGDIFIICHLLGIFIFLIVAGSIRGIKQHNTPAICSRCQNIMCQYYYTDEVIGHNIKGMVYICHDCKEKFIDREPTYNSAG